MVYLNVSANQNMDMQRKIEPRFQSEGVPRSAASTARRSKRGRSENSDGTNQSLIRLVTKVEFDQHFFRENVEVECLGNGEVEIKEL